MRPVSIHTAAWRYPGGTPDANFNLKALISYAQTLERGKFDAFFMADHLAVLNMPMEALKRSATVTSFDPLTLAAGAGHDDQASRPDRHGLDHLRARLHHRPPLRLARSHFGRPRRLEPGDHVQPRRRAQFRHGRADGACRALRPRPRVLRRRHRPVGFMGRRRLHPRRRERKLFRSRQAPCAEPQGQISEGEGPAQRRPADPGLAGDGAGWRLRCRPPARRRDRRSGVRRRRADRGGPRLLCRREGHGRPRSAAIPIT